MNAVDAEEQARAAFQNHQQAVYRYFACVYDREADAEEVTQQVFLLLARELSAGASIPNVRAWAMTKGRVLMLERLRVSVRSRFLMWLGAGGARIPPRRRVDMSKVDHDKRPIVNRMEGLDHLERECLYARAHGLNLREIAAMMGWSRRRTATIMGRAIQHLDPSLRRRSPLEETWRSVNWKWHVLRSRFSAKDADSPE